MMPAPSYAGHGAFVGLRRPWSAFQGPQAFSHSLDPKRTLGTWSPLASMAALGKLHFSLAARDLDMRWIGLAYAGAMVASLAMVGTSPPAMAQTSGPRASCLSFPQVAPLAQRRTEELARRTSQGLNTLAHELYRATNGTEVDWAESARLSRLVMERTERFADGTFGRILWRGAAKRIREIHEVGLYGAQIDFAEIERIYALEEARGIDVSADRARTDRLRRGYADYLSGLELGRAGQHGPALERLRRAGEAGVVQAQYYVGRYYTGERGIEANFAEAYRWFSMAGQRDHSDAMYYVGSLLYRNVPGVTLNQRGATEYFYMAAQRNHAYAMLALGMAFQHGTGLSRNRDEALCWYRRALAVGNDLDGSRAEAQRLINAL